MLADAGEASHRDRTTKRLDPPGMCFEQAIHVVGLTGFEPDSGHPSPANPRARQHAQVTARQAQPRLGSSAQHGHGTAAPVRGNRATGRTGPVFHGFGRGRCACIAADVADLSRFH